MASREEILRQIRNGQPMVVGGGGSTIRPAGQTYCNRCRGQTAQVGLTLGGSVWGAHGASPGRTGGRYVMA